MKAGRVFGIDLEAADKPVPVGGRIVPLLAACHNHCNSKGQRQALMLNIYVANIFFSDS